MPQNGKVYEGIRQMENVKDVDEQVIQPKVLYAKLWHKNLKYIIRRNVGNAIYEEGNCSGESIEKKTKKS